MAQTQAPSLSQTTPHVPSGTAGAMPGARVARAVHRLLHRPLPAPPDELRAGPLREGSFTSPLHNPYVAAWLGDALAAGAVTHDLVLVPLVFALGRPLAHLLPVGARRWLATGLALSLVLLVLAWPGLHSPGRPPDNPTVLPLDYGRGLVLSLAVLWSGLFLVYVMASLRSELRRPAVPSADSP